MRLKSYLNNKYKLILRYSVPTLISLLIGFGFWFSFKIILMAEYSSYGYSDQGSQPEPENLYTYNSDGSCTSYLKDVNWDGTAYVTSRYGNIYDYSHIFDQSFFIGYQGYSSFYGVVDWDISAIPDLAIINSVDVKFESTSESHEAYYVDVIEEILLKPSETSASDLINSTGDILWSGNNLFTTGEHIVRLGNQGEINFQNRLVDNSFILRFKDEWGDYWFKSVENTSGRTPTLVINYFPHNPLGENGIYYGCDGVPIEYGINLLNHNADDALVSPINLRSQFIYDVSLKSQPMNEVLIMIKTPTGVTANPSVVLFDKDSWNQIKSISLNVNQYATDGSYQLIHEISTDDLWYKTVSLNPYSLIINTITPTPTPTTTPTPTNIITPTLTPSIEPTFYPPNLTTPTPIITPISTITPQPLTSPKLNSIAGIKYISGVNHYYWTNGNNITVTGTGQVGGVINGRVKDTEITCTGLIRPDGAWSCNFLAPFPKGYHNLEFYVSSSTGLQSKSVELILGINVGIAQTGDPAGSVVVLGLIVLFALNWQRKVKYYAK
jgi:hypothetical protein